VKKSEPSSENSKPERLVLNMLSTFYGAMGNPPEATGALVLMARALASRADPEAINAALNRCTIECRFPVRLPDIFRRIPGLDADANAEKRLAWDVVIKFALTWLRWNEDRTYAWVEDGAPQLTPRILDTVRRSGGLSVYLGMTDEDFPFVQKRFFEEYEAWVEVQHVAADPSRILEMPQVKQLAAAKAIERAIERSTGNVQEVRLVQNGKRAAGDPQKARILKTIRDLRVQRRI